MLASEVIQRQRGKEAPKTLSVLVIEDCKSDVFLVEHMLREVSPEVLLYITDVPRLADAFKIIERENFDVVLLDLNLLDIQGVASVAALHSEIPNTPIIVYSGMDDPKLLKESLLCGATDYVVKGKETGQNLKDAIDEAIFEAHKNNS